jgi:ATP synthase protein I
MADADGDREQKIRERRQLLEASSIGWMFPIAIGIGFGWGWGMDKLFGTRPWLTIVFTAFGVIAAFINLFKIGLRDSGGSQ